MKLFPTLPTDLGNRCDDYHISTATTTTGMNEFLCKKQPNEVGPIRRAKGAKSSRQNHHQLHQRLKEGKYQVQPLRRVYIPKEDGKQRPLSIPALEDKLVQKVAVDLLNAIYEQDFSRLLFRVSARTGQHQALDEVDRVIYTRPIGWVLEIDIRSYFDRIARDLLVEMIEERVSDGSMLRLIGKWIKVGVIEDGRLLVSETGTGQGQPISPLLANIYSEEPTAGNLHGGVREGGVSDEPWRT